MKQKTKEKVLAKPSTEGCHHYWIIEVANGPTSLGVCKYCHAKKEFLNAFPDFNPMKRGGNPLVLPELPKVDVDEETKS